MDGELPEFVPLDSMADALPEALSDRAGRAAVGRAKTAALRLLKARDRTPRALADRLRGKGFEPAVVEHVVARLEAVGLLDERATAGRLVRAELRKSAASERLLQMKLRKAGVGEAVAAETIAEGLAGVDLEEAVEEEARRWLERRPGLETEVAKRRLAGRLARRGFGGELVWGVVNRVVGERG